ncbi:Leucine-rich repeat transmembrane protein kinase family protein [Striga hermonthica]|uniref:Leucine-rich repeat transmembrane protein kinase family protein n=1 Tax=Striga hermonthica TaxID=68872 RepID=A0A9N7N0Z4_STRHE|nr:Leucine-rich repeat transmembrane protein kinase family protein [Striga hermonthica]
MKPILSAHDPLSHALLSLKSEIVDSSNSLKDWVLPPPGFEPSAQQIHACSWSGVRCSDNSSKLISLDLSTKNLGGSLSGNQFPLFSDLVHLNLSHNSFSGQLPAAIFNLTGLKTLDVRRNNFSGHFPGGVSNLENLVVLDAFSNSFSGPLPADVSKIASLKTLNFAGSYFSGPIPSDYGSFRSIEFIHLAGNFLGGKIPAELGNLKTLTHMEIGYNSYDGEIPWQFGNMSELQYLDIADANISGAIPEELSNLTKLESLFLFRNLLTGKIPARLSRISTLESLDLSDNLLSGPIPDSFSELRNLRLLSLMYNDMSGPVPHGIAKLPFLDTLLIWNNYFTGPLPEDLGRFSKLKHLDVSTNYLVGTIPPDICSGGELQKLILFSNNFTGGLSQSLQNCSSLVRLRVEDNSFSGNVSLTFGSFPYISYMDLSRNKFSGQIPWDIDRASSLEYFNVSYNLELGGVLPGKIWSLPNLQNFSMISCGVSADIPPFEDCDSLSVLELRMNNLSGNIPESISNCKQLLIMDIANNHLTGQIPVGLASLPVITVLDLSHNHLSGYIPDELGSSTSLKRVNFSYNDISGPIPSSQAFKGMEQSAFSGNPGLCGPPLRPCHHENGLSSRFEIGSRRAQKLAWVLILCAVVILFIVASVFGFVYFNRERKGHWRMISFNGLPDFTAKDVLRSFNYAETLSPPLMPDSISKVVLPTGITVSAKKVVWESKEMKAVLRNLTRIGNVRHENLTRLLGVCYNNHLAYLLYNYMPNGNLDEKIGVERDWGTKCELLTKIARGLCFLHQGCFPVIAHGNLKAGNVVFDENMEPHLAEYGLNLIVETSNYRLPAKIREEPGGGFGISLCDELHMDVYNFGQLILEVVTGCKLANASDTMKSKSEDLIAEIARANANFISVLSQDDVKLVVEVALLCMNSRPSMQDVVKLLTGLKSTASAGAGKDLLKRGDFTPLVDHPRSHRMFKSSTSASSSSERLQPSLIDVQTIAAESYRHPERSKPETLHDHPQPTSANSRCTYTNLASRRDSLTAPALGSKKPPPEDALSLPTNCVNLVVRRIETPPGSQPHLKLDHIGLQSIHYERQLDHLWAEDGKPQTSFTIRASLTPWATDTALILEASAGPLHDKHCPTSTCKFLMKSLASGRNSTN